MNYHRSHVQGYARITACLYELVKPKASFIWTEEHDEAVNHQKERLATAPCLAFPTPDGQFIFDCDASDNSIGAELSQIQDNQERIISYATFVLLPQQRRYCTTRKELLLAVVHFCRYFQHYLLGRPFTIRTDRNSLAWLTRFRHIEGQLARWLEELSRYDFTILHQTFKKDLSPKLQSVWKGPFLIVKAKPPLYLVKTRKREKYLHHNNL